MTKVFTRGPFGMRRLLYRAGFDWHDRGELRPGWEVAPWQAPSWASSDGIIGEYSLTHTRLVWFGIPLTRWMPYDRHPMRLHLRSR